MVARASWMATAASTASTGLGNSTRNPSPVVLNTRPPCPATEWLDHLGPKAFDAGQGSSLVLTHQAREPDNVRRQDRRQASLDFRAA